MKRLAVINVVGLTQAVLDASTHMRAFAAKGSRTAIVPAFPAVTCTAQSTYLTGLTPTQHGIVGNGWYDRTLSEVQFWKQSNRLVAGAKVWEDLRREFPGFTCAKVFWWYNMYSTADWSLTPRPMYPADGRKIFDIYTHPASIRTDIKQDLGEFPFPSFWGPIAGIKSSQWIAESAKWVERRHQPTLNLIYLPHLDYNLQRLGPKHPGIQPDIAQIDAVVGDLIAFFAKQSVEVVLLSEYGISAVSQPIHLNRLFRDQGWIAIREELGLELLDAGASRVFAVADHQVAHPRAGDLIAVSDARSWFTYYYWLDDRRAPDFARCVDIHRKSGYDPVELFVDPALAFPKLKIAAALLRKKLGFRTLMNVIPLNATLVKGSHGRIPDPAEYPLFITQSPAGLPPSLPATDVNRLIKAAVA